MKKIIYLLSILSVLVSCNKTDIFSVKEIEGEYTDYFAYLVKEIFMTMRYQVGEAEKIDADTYKVEVKYSPVNVFALFIEGVEALSAELEARLENGYYEGTEEEQEELMLIDYLESSYVLLGEAYLQMEYGEQETFTFTVTRSRAVVLVEVSEVVVVFTLHFITVGQQCSCFFEQLVFEVQLALFEHFDI